MADNTAKKQPLGEKPVRKATIVPGAGSDDEIRALCAEAIEGWSDLRKPSQDEIVQAMRTFESLPGSPRVLIERDDEGRISIWPAADQNATLHVMRMIEGFGSRSNEYTDERVSDLVNYHNANNGRGATSQNVSAALAFVRGAEPADTVQSTLAVQMVATHDAAMRALGMIGKSEWIDNVQMFGNLANKLLNTYARQAEALAKLQRGGEQVVKHIHIDNRGGQAVVTENLTTGGRRKESGEQSYGTDYLGECASLPRSDPFGDGVPVPGDAREEAVPDSRGRKSGRAEGK